MKELSAEAGKGFETSVEGSLKKCQWKLKCKDENEFKRWLMLKDREELRKEVSFGFYVSLKLLKSF